ncbi:Na+/H+ antiporter NhaA [Yunchengibacter salinarum]|uniref:Na+/H+ antiporter NhaA n=1 Tax=Yunchengibacter salinarum TaxID=3133399 RepID=UPI0035B612B0
MSAIMARIQDFIRLEVAAGLILIFAALAALIASNSPLAGWYDRLLETPMIIQVGTFALAKPLLLWINDGLMAVFFFLVGLEVKREVLQGELSSVESSALPALAALGGMAGPALIYAALNWQGGATLDGWAIPAATDIAFALGILALLGPRVPATLKILLLAIAIIDDLGAIVIIALFYTDNLSLGMLIGAGIGIAVLIGLNRLNVLKLAPYVLTGVVIWALVVKSGVHATLAGVLVAFTIPLGPREDAAGSPLHRAEHALHPWVAFMVVPIFGFANAGVSFDGVALADLAKPVPLGIALGLFAGKQIGVMAMVALVRLTGLGALPAGTRWPHLYGLACLTGIGFTMSLFIGTLAFDTPEMLNQVRLGVLVGSVASALLGFLVLKFTLPDRAEG